MIIFIIVIFIWLYFGLMGVLRCKEERVNYEMLIFFISAIFIPIIGKILLKST